MSALPDLDVFAYPLQGVNLIEASAGTGKTWNICGLYLRLLLECELPVERILVVTFTKAATAELRERIRNRTVETLAQLDGQPGGGDPFVPQLLAAVRTRTQSDDATLRARLNLALQAFDTAAIHTIHGFCQRALEDTPFAAGLPFRLEVSPDDSDLIRETVADFWRREIAVDSLRPELAGLLLRRGDTPESWAKLLRKALARPLARVEWPPMPQTGLSPGALQTAFEQARTAFDSEHSPLTALESAREQGAIDRNKVRPDAPARADEAWRQCFDSGDILFTGIAPDAKDSPLRFFRASFLAQATKNVKPAPTHAFFEAADALIELYLAHEKALEAERLNLIRSMLAYASDALRAAKRRARLVAYDDMLANLYRALNAADGGRLAQALRERYPAALIDEFQDTDPVQFAVFTRIYAPGNAHPQGPLFLVGDPKQAIYSFRNADLHTYLAARENAHSRSTLRDNQRSSGELIAGLNALFNANPAAFVLPRLAYASVRVGAKPRAGFVDATKQASAALQLWELPSGEDGGLATRRHGLECAAAACADEIARLIGAGQQQQIRIGGRALAPSDIAILVRSHKQAARMKAALALVGIASVEISQDGVFQSLEALELLRVLHAVREPARVGLLRAALATTLIGATAAGLAALDANEALLQAQIARFADLRELWNTRGIGMMLRRWLADEHDASSVTMRLLAQNNGERRMTNLLHLAELLQQASHAHPSPEALLRWFANRLQDDAQDEVAQLRLESDRKLVQIITIHKAKGLEYPITFAPFLWDGYRHPERNRDFVEYHDATGQVVLDFHPTASEDAALKQQRMNERFAEDVRLIYVALTRAVFRSYVVVGNYVTSSGRGVSAKESARGMLNWLAAGKDSTPEKWNAGETSAEAISAAWKTIAAEAPEAIALTPLPSDAAPGVGLTHPDPERLAALPAPSRIPDAWRIGSFSRLVQGARNPQGMEQDHDLFAATEPVGPTPREIDANDILHFPRGASAGDCLHAAFEHADFRDPGTWKAAAALALQEHPQRGADVARHRKQIMNLLQDVCATPLLPDFRLADLPASRRLTELGFHLSNGPLAAARLNAWLAEHGYRMPPLNFQNLHGHLAGFIDLVFEHAGRYWLLDWKSNLLGFAPNDYCALALEAAMTKHGYHLQYLLYTLALHRYLRRRLPAYDYDAHIGGALYLFVRGVRPAWRDEAQRPAGVYFRRPSRTDIESLDALIGYTVLDTKAMI
ncbi:MAG: exodeoxyribonuclease V subunit beta [Betaproteobacteria bacterium]|nr:exodeoxyribonuclease V subunit beta [Betaproteobacteria bacterium]